MFCLYCGTQLPEDAVFCNKCGRRQNAAVSTSDITILPGPLIPETLLNTGQAPIGKAPIVQGTPSVPDSLPLGEGASDSVGSPSDAAAMPSLISYTSLARSAEPSQAYPAHHSLTMPQGTSSAGVKLTGHLSRRAVLGGLAGATTVVVASGGLAVGLLSGKIKLPFLPGGSTTVTQPPVLANTNFPMFGFDPQHTRFNPSEHILSPTNVSRLVLYWTSSIGGGHRFSSPAVVNGTVYVGPYAFDAKSGTSLRMALTGGDFFDSSPAVVNGVLYTGSDKLYAFDIKTGKTLWSVPTGNTFSDASPVVANSVVYVSSVDSNLDNKLYAIDAKTGTILWTAFTGRTGVYFSPAVANGVVYVGSLDHKLYAVDAKTGTILWTYTTGDGIQSSPAVANDVVYVGSADRHLYALNATIGRILWAAPTGDSIGYSSSAVANGIVYVGAYDGKLYAFDTRTGGTLWAAHTGRSIWSSPAVANGVVYISSIDGELYAFDARTGGTLWNYTIKATYHRVISSPAVANGVVYFSSWAGKLYAFHLPG